MVATARFKKDNKMRKFTKSYHGQETVEDHEGTRHIEEEDDPQETFCPLYKWDGIENGWIISQKHSKQ